MGISGGACIGVSGGGAAFACTAPLRFVHALSGCGPGRCPGGCAGCISTGGAASSPPCMGGCLATFPGGGPHTVGTSAGPPRPLVGGGISGEGCLLERWYGSSGCCCCCCSPPTLLRGLLGAPGGAPHSAGAACDSGLCCPLCMLLRRGSCCWWCNPTAFGWGLPWPPGAAPQSVGTSERPLCGAPLPVGVWLPLYRWR